MGVDHDPVFIIGFHVDLKQAKALISDEELKVLDDDESEDYEFFEEAAAMLECKYQQVGNHFTGHHEYYFVCEYPKPKEFGLYDFDEITALAPKLEHIRLRAKERGVDLGRPMIGASLLTW
jgi:hypothetical protein